MEIVAVVAPNELHAKLSLIEPYQADNDVRFYIAPVDEVTKVTWRMHGQLTFFQKVFAVFVSMDDLVGPDFKRGLESLKVLVEQ